MGINIKDFQVKGEEGSEIPRSKVSLSNILSYDIKLFSFHFSDRSKESFYLELSTLFSAGLDIKSSLELVIQERADKNERKLIESVLRSLIQGDSLSEALERTNQFTPYEYFSVKIGEESGKLALVLSQLYLYFFSKLKQKRKVISALSYPFIILITAIAAVAFMLTFVVPMFKDIFKRFGGELPALTKWIISLSDGLSQNFYLFLILIIIFSGLFIYVKRFPWFIKNYAFFLLRIPIIGKLISSMHLSIFCSSMSLLLGAKVPLVSTLGLIQKMIPFYPIQNSLSKIESDILLGLTLHESMSKHSIYDKRMLVLIKVGEEVNKLDYFFSQLNQKFDQDIDHQTSLLSTFFEPFIIIFLGVIVAFILIAMYLPMFQISNQVGS
jgi:type IV pilus assembly protein PilC